MKKDLMLEALKSLKGGPKKPMSEGMIAKKPSVGMPEMSEEAKEGTCCEKCGQMIPSKEDIPEVESDEMDEEDMPAGKKGISAKIVAKSPEAMKEGVRTLEDILNKFKK